MQIVKEGDRYVARCPFEEKDIAKGAGFRWDRDRREWWTASVETAAALAKFAAPDIADQLGGIATRQSADLDASRAKEAEIEVPAPDGLEYLPFQKAGIAYARGKRGVLIADEMGLGKTIEVIGEINTLADVRNILVVCPASLKINWSRELQKWLVASMSIGIADSQTMPKTDVVIINYESLKKHHEAETAIFSRTWDVLVLDEGHYIKNEKAQRSQMVRAIKATRVRILTGTPIVNRPKELWNLINFLDPVTWAKFWPFAMRYCNAKKERFGWDTSGAANLEELQRKLRQTIMIRRLKADVLTELPPKVRQVMPMECSDPRILRREAEMQAKHQAAMDAAKIALELAKAEGEEAFRKAVDNLQDRNRIAFEEMARVRHETALAKVPDAKELLEQALEASGNLVVFAHHHDVIAEIMKIFGDVAVKLTGEMDQSARQRSVDLFQSGAAKVFVGSIQAAGVGLTLTAASHVIFMEEDWVPGNISQAEDRLHRIGQKDSVLVQHFVYDDSIDSRMAKTMIKKQRVIEKALDKECDLVLPEVEEKVAPIHTTTAEIAKEAEAITPEMVAKIHEGLRILAGMCDGARSLDGAGFSKIDAGIGRSLAEAGRLSQKQAALGRRLVRKYRRQLGEIAAAVA